MVKLVEHPYTTGLKIYFISLYAAYVEGSMKNETAMAGCIILYHNYAAYVFKIWFRYKF